MAEQAEHKRQRVSKACEQCRRKKVKCDGSSPLCNNCQVLGLSCLYKESTKKRGPPKGYIEAIEGRLHRLEALLGSIIQEDDPHSQAIMAELNAPLETAYGELVRPRPMRRETISGYEAECGPLTTVERNHMLNTTQQNNNNNDDELNNTNNLSIDESGQLRYYGKSSGFYMLKNSKNLKNRSFQFNSRVSHHDEHHNHSSSTLSFTVDPFEMPPKDLSDHLLDLYFSYFYPLLPLLHKKSFMESIQDHHKPSPPPLLLNAIYAVASRISPDIRVRSDPLKPETAGDIFFERARMLLDFEWDSFRLYTVQSLLLMSSHQNGALKTTRGWLYSGMAIRMSQNLGLHRDCDKWDLTATEKEERKRVFYCCFILDKLSCAMHGRSPMIDERDYDTPYPSENDEDDIHRKPRIMENFYYLIKICEILEDVIRELYMVKGRKQLSMLSTPDSIVSALDKKINKWISKLPPNLQYRPPNTRLNERAPAPSLELCQLHMLLYTTLILTHRPFIPGPSQTVVPTVFPSASICTFAANKILDITESLMAEGRLKNINNYTLFFMFTAGIIFIYNAASTDSMFAFEAKISINKIMRAMDEVEKTWITSARHCNILGALAGLRDIDLDCVDESYTHSLKKFDPQASNLSASIAVPNSPEPEPEEEKQQREIQSTMTHDFQRMEEKYYNTCSKSPQGSSIDLSPESTNQRSSSYLQQQSQEFENNPFDPNETAFWGMPMSFDIDEWNSYFNNQKNNMASSSVNTTSIFPMSSEHEHASQDNVFMSIPLTTSSSITTSNQVPLWTD
ncbi:fungal-specific transcription factor domain-containing protein [Cokeromyces recurvatus]|uniref:fungal-specific transcription factor domain-containing protein n=1 Tax=Cokeromyces recurvatus TaxID=90255 RepID=UPI0022205AF3|nr:fungal-specific transcription factor domain-containing protein [Cokeromyces recurvatus]KAI7905506.1 fungal-specific transcription factor domain-containing protein [Cokeromyces recurvatus]